MTRPGKAKPLPGTFLLTLICHQQWRNARHHWRVINIFLRHAERFGIMFAAGAAQRFGIAPGIEAMLALVDRPDIFTGDFAITSICSSAQRGQIILFSLFTCGQHSGQFFSPGFGFR